MEKKHQEHNLIILDESRSMESIKHTIILGFIEIVGTVQGIEKQFPEQLHFISLIFFTDSFTKLLYFIDPVEALKKIEGDAYKPDASTPLYDAMDMGITKLINLITDEGLDLKFIDKASGLAMSDELSFYTTQTAENKKENW